jgi:flap endonuclease-1
MTIYQFLIAVRSGGPNQQAAMLTNADGETTSHIQGMFNRTIRFITEGIRPVFVFDGKPPNIKSGELLKRREKREKAQAALKVATEEENFEEQDKQSKRLVRAGQKENEDCRKLLRLMGVPVVMAPCEAEAQASALAESGAVYAVGTEDMDALTFRTPVLVRKMTFANASKSMVQTMNYAKALEGLEVTKDQFVDLCIMLGCDYCDSIKGIGPKTALKLIREHKNIETILQNIDRKKFTVPGDWVPNEKAEKTEDESQDEESPPEAKADDEQEELIPVYVQARKLFNEHEVDMDVELKWKPCDAEGLTKFLVDEMAFNPERVKANIEKLQKAYTASSKPQTRMDSFFTVKPNPNAAKIAAKRKAEKTAAEKSKKKGKVGKKK